MAHAEQDGSNRQTFSPDLQSLPDLTERADWKALIDDAAYEINQRWGEPLGDDEFGPMDETLVRETAEAILRPIFEERDLAARDADRRSCQGGWKLAQERAIALIHAAGERDELRAGISWARGMCTDGRPVEEIDHFLGCVLAGQPQVRGATDEEDRTDG